MWNTAIKKKKKRSILTNMHYDEQDKRINILWTTVSLKFLTHKYNSSLNVIAQITQICNIFTNFVNMFI